MLLTGATMGISEIIQCTDASHAILFQQFNCAAAFGNQAVVRTISNPHHIVVRISTSFWQSHILVDVFLDKEQN